MEEKILEEAGLTKNEAIVYLKLSELGVSSAYRVSKESGLFKPNVYESLKSLETKALVSKKIIDKKVVYEASDPSFLLNLLDSKRDKIDNLIPSIRQLQKSVRTESVFNTYKGVDAFIGILHNFLRFQDEILVYGAPKKAYDLLRPRIDSFHQERIGRKIRMKHIYNFEAIERIRQLGKMPFTDARYLHELFNSEVSTNICGDEVVFVIWVPPIKIIQIKDAGMAKAYKNYFEILWKNAKR